MSEEQREIAFEALQNHSEIKTTIHVNDNDRIDEINILAASLEVWCPRQQNIRITHPPFCLRIPHVCRPRHL